MKSLSRLSALLLVLVPTLAVAGCGDDDEGMGLSPAQQSGVGAECTQDTNCNTQSADQICLTEFKGGYCGERNCTGDADCLAGSACVAHDLGNFCFLICTDKSHCNGTRTFDNEANCVSNINFVGGAKGDVKVCVPPSSGV